MDQAQNPKQQIVEKLKNANNVLVTVSTNPSIDQLAAAIGLTLMLDKLGKHATAVYSGETPNAIEFLNPSGNIHKNTDSLQDFIISLDASKADKLRYKRDGDVAKIFITPYKSSISEGDLTFSQGDVNVDAVVALGVDQKDHLDQAIVSHGRILHDAAVMTIMNSKESSVGSVNWQDGGASSLSEMIVSISEAFQSGLIDAQIATAFLTGIVAETDRFKNNKTSPKVMTMSAQLMSAGANQQLIADNLSKPEPVPEFKEEKPAEVDASEDVVKDVAELETQKEPVKKVDFKNEKQEKKEKNESDTLAFSMHDIDGDVEYNGEGGESKSDDEIEVDLRADKIHIDNDGNLKAEEEQAIAKAMSEADDKQEPKDTNQPYKDDQIAATGTLDIDAKPSGPSSEGQDGSQEKQSAEGGESYALKKGLKVIQPLPPEEEKPAATSAPALPAERTLDDIESRATAPQVDATEASTEQAVIEAATPVSQDDARNNVEQAINSGVGPSAPEPVQALNALPLEDETDQPPQAAVPAVESTAPPLPPPPIDPTSGPSLTLPQPGQPPQ